MMLQSRSGRFGEKFRPGRDFFIKNIPAGPGAYQAFYLMGTGVGLERRGRKVGHSFPFTTEVRNE